MQIDRFYVAHEHPGEQLRTGPGRIRLLTKQKQRPERHVTYWNRGPIILPFLTQRDFLRETSHQFGLDRVKKIRGSIECMETSDRLLGFQSRIVFCLSRGKAQKSKKKAQFLYDKIQEILFYCLKINVYT